MAYPQYARRMVAPVATSEREHDIEAALDALDLARRRFVNVVGHELRTPVTTLRGLSEELIQATEEELRDLAPAILRSARRVETLLDDLLLATDITTALPVGDPEPVDLVTTAQATWDAIETDAELTLTGDHEAIVKMRPRAADTMLERVLDNAMRYGSPPFGFHAEADGDPVRITVSSEGAELSADDVHLAFELFYRGEGAVTSAPGFGLGLPVARALARQHDGDLHLDPRSGGGLDVTIYLPAGG
jgi:two-component system, OmpR family, phosphate regulon sensor histidine kinase PhoR